MSSFGVVLDACVLFPGSLRDTLLRAAEAGLYRIQLTDEILEEMRRNLVKKGMSEERAQKIVDVVNIQFADGFVTQHHLLITSMPNDEKDRHVLAAAVSSKAQTIVTQNLRDFPKHLLEPFEVEAQSPDDFLVHLFYLESDLMVQILVEQASELRNPSKTVFEVLDTLMQHAPRFSKLVQQVLKGNDADSLSYSISIESDVS